MPRFKGGLTGNGYCLDEFRVIKMIFIQSKTQNVGPGDMIAFFKGVDFIGYGIVAAVYENEIAIDEDASIKAELEAIDATGISCNIEIV